MLPCSHSVLCLMSQALQQEKHVLQRKLEMNELASGQREAELAADLAVLRADLERRHNQGRDRRRDESEQLTQLANHNQRLVEKLAEVGTSTNLDLMRCKATLKKASLCHNAAGTNTILGVCVCLQPYKLEECSSTGLDSFVIQHNSALQLSQAVTLEHSLRTELRSLREEMEESSFSRNINFTQLESIEAEVHFQVKALLSSCSGAFNGILFYMLKKQNDNNEKYMETNKKCEYHNTEMLRNNNNDKEVI